MEAMPGPQFNGDMQDLTEGSWLKRHAQKIVLSLIVVLIGVGGYYFYKSYQDRQELLRPALEGTEGLAELPGPSPSPTVETETPQVLGAAMTKVETPEVKKQSSQLVAKAARGNGATHLARQALKEYLGDKTDLANQLKAEHKIYIEDYLQKHVEHPKILHIGDELTFSDDLMKEAIGLAQKLTDSQINNLHKYVLLVPSLQTP